MKNPAVRILSIFFFLILIKLFSCGKVNEQNDHSHRIKLNKTRGYVVPADSMAAPIVIQLAESKLNKKQAGKPGVVLTNTNVHIVPKPTVVFVDERKLPDIRPGTDTFELPKVMPATSVVVRAGVPTVVIAKDADIKDHNPRSFSSFTKLHGLQHASIQCMLKDRSGKLWFGTWGGGVSCYNGKNFTHYTKEEGLINNTVFSMLEDRDGNLWFGTEGGLCKYDGDHFTHFTEKDGLSDNVVLSLLEDRAGNLWIGTKAGGVNKYNGNTLSDGKPEFTQFTTAQGLSGNHIYSIIEDREGNFWFGTYKKGVNKYNGQTFKHFTKTEGLNDKSVKCMYEDKSGNIWFGSIGNGVAKYDGKSFTQFSTGEGLCHKYVSDIFEDRAGNLWFSTYGGGVSKYDGEKQADGKASFTNFSTNEGLSSNNILCAIEDPGGGLWFGTHGRGINKYLGDSFSHFTEIEGLSNDEVFGIMEDGKGNLWFSTWGGGVNKYDGKSFAHFTEKEGLSSNIVYSVLEDRSGDLWFGTAGKGLCKYDGENISCFNETDGLSNNYIFCMLEDRQGNLWLGTNGGGVCKMSTSNISGSVQYTFTHFTEKEGLSDNYVSSIVEDHEGNFWFGTWGNGVSKLTFPAVDSTSMYHFTHFTEKEGLLNNRVWGILEDSQNNLWFGTNGGVNKLYTKESTDAGQYIFAQFTEKEGLSNKAVLSMFEDSSGNLWFGTRAGLCKMPRVKAALFDARALSARPTDGDIYVKNYGYADGFYGMGVNGGNTMVEDKSGAIWIATNDRLTVHYPDNNEDTLAPVVQLESIELFNEKIDWLSLQNNRDTSFNLGNGVTVGNFTFDRLSKWNRLPQHLSLPYDNNFLTFNFIGITMNQSEKVRYQYMLEGMDDNWSADTYRNSAPYGNLSHGDYAFKVKAMNSEGFWSDEYIYPFIIRAPWWETWWAFAAYVLAAMGSVIFIVWWNGRRLRARARQLETEVAKATVEIKNEKQKSDNLILNILPEEVAEELKNNGTSPAKQYKNVTVLFTDFVNFTGISGQLTPTELVEEVHKNFSVFDQIIELNGLEKIKTIGDAYLAVCGLPNETPDHVQRVVKAALEIRDYVDQSNSKFEIRIGINTGTVVAGIVGVKKYAYDIWGDTVNTAARLEQSSEPGKINISGSTYVQLRDFCKCEYRGQISVKNKGKIDMYFVESLLAEQQKVK